MVKEVLFGSRETKKQGVFATFVVKEWRPWLNYEEDISEEAKKTNVPIIFMVQRWDGTFGFPGGFVGDHAEEDLAVAAQRELIEEIAHTNFEGFNPVASHCYKDKLTVHLYGKEVSYEEFRQIEDNVKNAMHYGSEVLSTVRVPVFVTDDGRGLPNYLQHKFPTTVLEEIISLIRHFNLMSEEDLEKSLKLANITL